MRNRKPTGTVAAPAEGLPPLPSPDQPADQVIPALIAWLGGPDAAASYLAADLEFYLREDDSISSDDYDRVLPMVNALQEQFPRADSEAHSERVREAIVRHGYDRLPLPPRDDSAE